MSERSRRVRAAALRRGLACSLFAAALPLDPVAAQVPRGSCAVSSFRSVPSSDGGVTLFHCLEGGGRGFGTPITGLRADLRGTIASANEGASAVLVGEDGNLVVGEHAGPGQTLEVHVITLAGNAVATDLAYPLGVVSGTGFGSVDQMAWLGPDIVVSVRGFGPLVTGPLVNQLVGIVRPRLGPPGTPGTVVPVPVSFNPPGTINALTLDPQGQNAFFAKFTGTQPNVTSTIHRLPVPGTGAPASPVAVAQVPGAVLSLLFVSDTVLLAGTGSNAGAALFHVDLASPTPVVTPVTTNLQDVNSMTLEVPTGTVMVGAGSTGLVYRLILASPSTGITSVVGVVTAGITSGIAIRQAMTTFGTATPGANAYAWQIAPNLGGLPSLGNAAFSLTLTSSPGGAPGFLGLALQRADPPVQVLGITLLLDPAAIVVPTGISSGTSFTFPLGIPSNPGVLGTNVFAQTVHVEPGGLAASGGLQFTVF